MSVRAYSCELRLRPNVVRSMPGARGVNDWSISFDDRMNASRPTMPNWSTTMPGGMFVTRPVTTRSSLYIQVYYSNLRISMMFGIDFREC